MADRIPYKKILKSYGNVIFYKDYDPVLVKLFNTRGLTVVDALGNTRTIALKKLYHHLNRELERTIRALEIIK